MSSSATTLTAPPWGDDADAAVAAVRERIQLVCRRFDAKSLARLAGVSVKAAEAWREGRTTPQPDGMARLAGALGREVLDIIYGPVIGAATLDQRAAALALHLDVFREDLRAAGVGHVVLGEGGDGLVGTGTGSAQGGAPSATGRTAPRARPLVAPALLMLGIALGAALAPLLGTTGDPLLRARGPGSPRAARVIRVVGQEC